ncbi:hypothetical protein [Paraliomyxa miuraensis]|uniref:hypothetical protein n=1 Tax=Paraliomyxa miuraensis TaxID=376150 RepID=UPI00224D7436|nr:hypothetical protein [Paraliomyxa miuraensis]MCX4240508.1 hypothetical protein [Paraliomyxa miuraensis]
MTSRGRSVLFGLALGLGPSACSGSATHKPEAANIEPAPHAGTVEPSPRPPAPPKETTPMTTESDPLIKLLHLSDAEHFTVTEERLLELQGSLSDAVEAGAPDPAALPPRLALGAPAQVDLRAQATVPLLLGSFQSGLRAWQVNFEPNLLVFVKDHASGELAFAKPLISLRRGPRPLPSAAGDPPDEINATATYAGVKSIDLAQKLETPLRPGRISVTAVAYDVRSNTVGLELQGDAPRPKSFATKSPHVRHELDERSPLAPELDVPGTGSVREGLKIRVAIQTSDEAAIVRTEFNQPMLSGHVILVRLDERPTIVPTFVPVQPVRSGDAEPAYNALYIADFGGADGHPIETGKYQVYVDVGVELRGPFELTVTE